MMLIRTELYCHGWPDGIIPHGHVDIRVKGARRGWCSREEWDHATSVVSGQISNDCYLCHEWGGNTFVDFDLIEEVEYDEFDRGSVYATVVGGEGDALGWNPIGTMFETF